MLRHIERLRAACTLKDSKSFAIFPIFSTIHRLCESARVDALTLQCHMPDMTRIKTVCVYCGSGFGDDPIFAETASALGSVTAGIWRRFAAADPDADFTRIFPFVADGPTGDENVVSE